MPDLDIPELKRLGEGAAADGVLPLVVAKGAWDEWDVADARGHTLATGLSEPAARWLVALANSATDLLAGADRLHEIDSCYCVCHGPTASRAGCPHCDGVVEVVVASWATQRRELRRALRDVRIIGLAAQNADLVARIDDVLDGYSDAPDTPGFNRLVADADHVRGLQETARTLDILPRLNEERLGEIGGSGAATREEIQQMVSELRVLRALRSVLAGDPVPETETGGLPGKRAKK